MMATTHAFAALAVVAPLAHVSPELAAPLAVGALLGGIAPDLDVVLTHRRTLHFPVLGAAPAVLAAGVAAVAPSSTSVAVAAFFGAAWLHAASDALGGGLEMNPWSNPTERAVYDHLRGRWIRPRRWVRYDGAPEDAALAVVLAVPALVVFDGVLAAAVAGGVAVSLGYALLRRRIAEWSPEWLE
ncbi:metal-dependent hydrolase [Natrononativus amylolyticus]|uniref:metal-dependent hydrolase n=1 Tax=Natrononativus amylolyticus TaxID=2963434 RepID=UPI0020CD0D87|nr:metal-dependent hydrolase [Natrononativus amylolyticus]